MPRVLVSDDDETTRFVVCAALEEAGFEILEAADGEQAVCGFESGKPDLVLLDVRMPVMDGFEACRRIRRLPGGDTAPIVMLTGLDDTDSMNKAYDAGATDFTTKPVNPVILSHRARHLLRAKDAFEALGKSEARLAIAQRIARIGYRERDLETGETIWSNEIYRFLGFTPGEVEPTPARFLDRVHADDREAVASAEETALREGKPYSIDFRVPLTDGTIRHLHEQADVFHSPYGKPKKMLGTVQDITDRKRAEERIRLLAYYDELTGLPNRSLFIEGLKAALVIARRRKTFLATLFLDLDRFKRINDTLGHGAGDTLLRDVAERLRKCLRASDVVARDETPGPADTVARLGGDEFIVSLPEIRRPEDAARVAQRLLDSLAAPFSLGGHEVVVGASIGISTYPQDGEDVETLLKNADAAMYHAKDSGGSDYQFYSRSMTVAALERLALESSLRRALEREEFLVHFQPIVNGETGTIFGAEVLIRWRHPETGLIPPADFVSLAEETGLIVPIGEWVLRTASARAREWCEAGLERLIVAVNLSGKPSHQKQVARAVADALERSGIRPDVLEMQISEGALMKAADETARTLDELKGLGVRVAVDDFGAAYSSLSCLRRFSVDTLKLDRSFVRDVATNPDDAAIAAAIIAMARSLKMEVIAEGVDTQEQAVLLRRCGCRYMLGSHFGNPVPANEFTRLLEQQAMAKRGAGAPEAVS